MYDRSLQAVLHAFVHGKSVVRGDRVVNPALLAALRGALGCHVSQLTQVPDDVLTMPILRMRRLLPQIKNASVATNESRVLGV